MFFDNQLIDYVMSLIKKVIFVTIVYVFSMSCRHEITVKEVVSPTFIDRTEFRQIINKYSVNKRDSLKLKAAFFLVENLPYHYSPSIKIDSLLNVIFNVIESKRQRLYDRRAIGKMADSVFLDATSLGIKEYRLDSKVIDKETIINSIELAFSALESASWKGEISFETFCEYILPYKLNTEPQDDWRNILYKKNRKTLAKDSSLNSIDKFYTYHLTHTYNWLRDTKHWRHIRNNYPINNYSWIKLMSEGDCALRCKLVIYNLRAISIPATFDFIPSWGNSPYAEHSYVGLGNNKKQLPKLIDNTNNLGVLVDNLNTTMTSSLMPIFSLNELPQNLSIQYVKTIPKIYRQTWSPQKEMLDFIEKVPIKEIYTKLIKTNIIDVTSQYLRTTNVEISQNIFRTNRACYLAVFDLSGWKPVAFSTFNIFGRAYFNNIGGNILFMPVVANEGALQSIGNPFIVDNSGKKKELIPNFEQQINMHLIRKYPLFAYSARYVLPFKGAQIQGSMYPDFDEFDNLALITDYPFFEKEIKVENKVRYKYLRIMTTKRQKARLGIFEAFSEGDGKLEKVKGEISRKDGYLQMSFDNPSAISQINIWPRNDRNYVIAGNVYELFYWDSRWKSVGKIKASANYLDYSNIPSGTVYWLHCLTEGREERLFTYVDDAQIWW